MGNENVIDLGMAKMKMGKEIAPEELVKSIVGETKNVDWVCYILKDEQGIRVGYSGGEVVELLGVLELAKQSVLDQGFSGGLR